METTLIQEEPFDGSASTELALGCFAIGTLFFILFLTLQDNSFILIIGFIFIVLASLLNIIMLTNLLYHFYMLPQQRKYIGTKIAILLSNIPLAFLYLGIIFYLTLTITFLNKTINTKKNAKTKPNKIILQMGIFQ